MTGRTVSVTSVGTVAGDMLAQAVPATVMGKTSRGLFLRLDSNWVIFLSFESHCGPLTLNLSGSSEAFSSLQAGAAAYCSSEEILFPGPGLSLPSAQAALWEAPALPAEVLASTGLREQLLAVVRLAARKPAVSPLLPSLLAILGLEKPPEPQHAGFYPLLERLETAYCEGQPPVIAAALEALLGLGPGLTPSGDDLAIGFLLALNRWGGRLSMPLDITWLNREIPSRAQRQTNALSASLIACAALGQADERLIAALDGLVTGTPHPVECASLLAGWGSSSGYDAFVGMALALLGNRPRGDVA